MTADRWSHLENLADANPNAMFGARAVADMLREATGWQPIETAPRDGTRILVHTYTGKTSIAWFCEETGLWPEDEVYSEDGEPCNVGWPTHWMPLPPAPKEERG